MNEYGNRGGRRFQADEDTVNEVLDELEPEAAREIREIENAAKVGTLPGKLMLAIRGLNLDVRHWVTQVIVACTNTLFLESAPAPSIAAIAHKCGMSRSDLEHMANHATRDEAGLLFVYLEGFEVFLKELQIPMTAGVKTHGHNLRLRLDQALDYIERNGLYDEKTLPDKDAFTAKIYRENQR